MFFLSETHLGKVKVDELKRKLQCDHYIIVESDGRSGGLLLFWRKDISIKMQETSQNFIDVLVDDGREWRLTGIYGEPRWEEMEKTWVALRTLHGRMHKPWLALGDFNEILFHHEEGGRPRAQCFLQAFSEALNDCSLSDVGYNGDIFTWQ